MIFKWFKIFNLTEFTALALVSKTYSYELQDIGLKDFIVTQGNETSITMEDIFLSVNMNDKNPFIFEGHGIYLDENSDVWFGFPV